MEKETQTICGVYHTHTKYSKFFHGKDSAKDMIEEAEGLGLKEYAITDHGTKHFFGITKKNIKKLRKIIDEDNKTRNVKTLMGMEFNLLGCNGETDYFDECENCLDIRLMGVHRAGRTTLKNFFKFILPNLFNGGSEKVIEMNTDAYIKAIKKYKIDIITHPQEYFRVDLVRLAKACVENNCYLEINNKHLNITDDELQELLKTDVKFIVSSDAHKKEDILRVDRAIELLVRNNVPEERIANLNKLPDFNKKY